MGKNEKMKNNFMLPGMDLDIWGDVYSRLFKERIIMLIGVIDDHVANYIKAQLLVLRNEDKTAPIKMYIDSPGGMVYTSMGILDIMDYISNPI